jgi:hypothetical protein
VGRRPQNQHRATTAAKGNNTRDEADEDRRAKKSPFRERKRRRREHGPGPRTLAPPTPRFFFWLNLVSWLNVFFEMAKNICVFLKKFSHQISTDLFEISSDFSIVL